MHTDFSKARRNFYFQSFRPRKQRGKNGRVKFNAVRELSRATCERGLAGQTHGRFSPRRGRFYAGLREETGLAQKRLASGEFFRVDELQKNRRAPASVADGAACHAEILLKPRGNEIEINTGFHRVIKLAEWKSYRATLKISRTKLTPPSTRPTTITEPKVSDLTLNA